VIDSLNRKTLTDGRDTLRRGWIPEQLEAPDINAAASVANTG
jgi:hypothetical protein